MLDFKTKTKQKKSIKKRKKEERKRQVDLLLLLVQYSLVFEVLKNFKSLRRRLRQNSHIGLPFFPPHLFLIRKKKRQAKKATKLFLFPCFSSPAVCARATHERGVRNVDTERDSTFLIFTNVFTGHFLRQVFSKFLRLLSSNY